MGRYTTQIDITFDKTQDYRGVIPDSGASVAVEFWNGLTWTTDTLSPITSPERIYTYGLRVRLTPSNGGFYIDEGGYVVN